MNFIAHAIFAVLLSVAATAASPAREPLNVILILADDLGYEAISANGGESYQTPNLDRMAANGVRFEHCYAQPLCTPSRVQLMTGKYNVRNYRGFGTLPRGERTFAHLLKQAGYATCIAGKWQLGAEPDAPQHFGFDEALLWQHTRDGRLVQDGKRLDKRYENPLLERNGVEESYSNGEYAPDLEVDFICDFMERKKDGPFLVYYPMILTHCPFVPTPDSADWNPHSQGSPTYKGDPKYFGDMVRYMDKLIGRIVAKVEELGLSDKTVILFTADNGTDQPIVSRLLGRDVAGGKGATTDAGTRVPLIASAPGLFKPRVVSDLIDFSDFVPTLCDLAKADLSSLRQDLDGRSFLPQLLGREGSPRSYVYSWYHRTGLDREATVFARNHRYKLYRDGRYFDVANDAEEKSPLVEAALSPEQRALRTELQAVIDRYAQFRTND